MVSSPSGIACSGIASADVRSSLLSCRLVEFEIGGARSLEEAPAMSRLAVLAVILKRPHQVLGRSCAGLWVGDIVSAPAAGHMAAPRRTGAADGAAAVWAGDARAVRRPFVELDELSALRAGEHPFRVAHVLGQQVAGKQRHLLAAVGALRQLDPEEVLHARVGATLLAGRAVEIADLPARPRRSRLARPRQAAHRR